MIEQSPKTRMSKSENFGQNESNLTFDSRKYFKSPETKWETNFGALVIAGEKGAGSSTLAKDRAAAYDIPESKLLMVGNYIRDRIEAETGRKILGFVDRDPEIDYEIDSIVRNIVMKAARHNPHIVEAQLGGLIALDTLKKAHAEGIKPMGPVIKVLVWARKDIRIKRIQEREGGMSLKDVRELTRNREEGDLEYWKSLYPWMGDINPLEKGARDAEGRRIYDFEIDSSDLTVQETSQELHDFLEPLGLVEEKRDLFLGYQRPINGN